MNLTDSMLRTTYPGQISFDNRKRPRTMGCTRGGSLGEAEGGAYALIS